MMISRRAVLTSSAAVAAAASLGVSRASAAMKAPVKIGNTMPYSGPASSYGVIGRFDSAFFRMVNDQGGVDGHKVDFISLDDAYSPPKTVEDIRRLVEEDHVDFTFNTLGTPTNTAIAPYMNEHKIPQLFVATGASEWSEYKKFPWTMGWQPNYRTEAEIYTKYALKHVKNPKFGILYQNDDFGKDYPRGVRDVLGKNWDKYVVKSVSYESTDPTIDSQIAEIQSSGANILIVGAIPKFAAQSIRKVHDLGFKPMFFMTNVSISVGEVMQPAGPENGVGIISTEYIKDPTDPAWKNDPGMKEWRAFMAKYMPHGDLTDASYVYAYGVSQTMLQVLKQCKGDFSRPNVMRQAENLHNLEINVLLPGIKINTSHTDHRPIKEMQLARWTGKTWKRFGNLISGMSV